MTSMPWWVRPPDRGRTERVGDDGVGRDARVAAAQRRLCGARDVAEQRTPRERADDAVGGEPCDRWNSRTAASVCGPKSPSAWMRSFSCTQRTTSSSLPPIFSIGWP
jgi:hypothetical protein